MIAVVDFGINFGVLALSGFTRGTGAGLVANELAALGAQLRIVSADITKESDVRRSLEQIAELSWGLKGIFHCAVHLLQMSLEKLWRVMALGAFFIALGRVFHDRSRMQLSASR